MTTALAYASAAERAILKAETIAEVKDIEARSKAVKAYMREVGIDLELSNDVARIQIEAGC